MSSNIPPVNYSTIHQYSVKVEDTTKKVIPVTEVPSIQTVPYNSVDDTLLGNIINIFA